VRRSHTLNANGGAVGLSLCGMVGAVERPFSFGDAPITPAQIDALAAETAELCAIYDIPVSRWSTLSHSEIQPTLGIKQNFKWDINWLPGMAGPGDPITCGDKIRALVEAKMR
jgi:N-acetyl-anhydromuramyl-L-alanine amidase AmpD